MYVCTQLTAPDAQGLQTCTSWILQDSATFLPSIPPEIAAQLSAAILMVYATIFVFNAIKRAL